MLRQVKLRSDLSLVVMSAMKHGTLNVRIQTVEYTDFFNRYKKNQQVSIACLVAVDLVLFLATLGISRLSFHRQCRNNHSSIDNMAINGARHI